jgi:CRISPR-associated endonuclease/helicase Cas3
VIIPFNEKAKGEVAALAAFEQGEPEHNRRPGEIARKLQRYLVNVPRGPLAELMRTGAVQPIAPRVFGEQFLQLANDHIYFDDIGLDWSDPAFRKAEEQIL